MRIFSRKFFIQQASVVFLLFCTLNLSAQMQQIPFNNYPVYGGNDLGVNYSSAATVFKIWSPMAEQVQLNIYENDATEAPIEKINLNKSENGVWEIKVNKNLINKYYTFQIQQDKKWLPETPDIYAKAVGTNGRRGMVVDLNKTNPENWKNDAFIPVKNKTDIILYELHVRDFSIHQNSGMKNKGNFLAFTESETKTPAGNSTGIDHIKDLGVSHIHLLPAFDFNSVDEGKPELKQYNWGYDPLHYNVPEGSYSSNPSDGNVRIREFKQMVQAIHNKGLGVIMDVVYNHTSSLNDSPFSRSVPGYYYRQNADGKFSDATGCGNETASERAMMQKYIIESVCYWAQEYHIDGFRFDLMGVHDIETMNLISAALHKINPNVFIYGEGWTAGGSPLDEEKRAIKRLTYNQTREGKSEIKEGHSERDKKEEQTLLENLALATNNMENNSDGEEFLTQRNQGGQHKRWKQGKLIIRSGVQTTPMANQAQQSRKMTTSWQTRRRRTRNTQEGRKTPGRTGCTKLG
jgi:pullulanase